MQVERHWRIRRVRSEIAFCQTVVCILTLSSMEPLALIEGPCFVGENKGQFAYIIDDKSMWSDKTFMTT